MAITPDQLAQIIYAASQKVFEIADRATDAALDASIGEGEGTILNRIFNKNQDINGASFGGYSTDYAEFRRSLGLDASNKNLQFTDNMRKTIFVDYNTKEVKLSDKTDKQIGARNAKLSQIVQKRKTDIPQYKKARYQEAQLGMQIFEVSKEEDETIKQVFTDVFVEEFLKEIRA